MAPDQISAAGAFVKTEGAKLLPLAGGLGFYGLTYQEWAARFAAAYGLALLIDFVGRRWLWPLAKFAFGRSKAVAAPTVCEVDNDPN